MKEEEEGELIIGEELECKNRKKSDMLTEEKEENTRKNSRDGTVTQREKEC